MSAAEPFARLNEYQDTILFPMVRDKRFRELCDRILELLATEHDPDCRFALITDLTTFLRYAGDDQESLRWAQSLTQEYADNPFAWTNLAGWYFYSPHPGSPSNKDRGRALEYFETALKIARQQNEFVRSVLFAICRVLTDMADYAALSEYMNEILLDMNIQREYDIPQFEADWLNRVPAGAIAPDLRETFIRLEAADSKRRQSNRFSTMAPTRSDLERGEGEGESE